MQAKDIMTTNVVTIGADAPIEQAAHLMLDHNVGGLPVVDAGGAVIGMISESDLVHRSEIGTERKHSWWLRLIASPRENAREFVREHSHKVADVMSTDVTTMTEDTPLADIANILEERRIKRLPVLDAGGHLVGIVSRANLLRALASRRKETPAAPSADDRALRQAVTKVIENKSWATYGPLNVIVNDGVVELWGYVESIDERKALLTAAGEVAGVKEVVDHLALLAPWTYGV